MKHPSNRPGNTVGWELAPPQDCPELEAWQREVEIFGDGDDLPADESAIVFDSNLPHEKMMVELKALRASKRVKHRSFARRMTRAGRIHAHALGILLD
jgi:hypothetical protein